MLIHGPLLAVLDPFHTLSRLTAVSADRDSAGVVAPHLDHEIAPVDRRHGVPLPVERGSSRERPPAAGAGGADRRQSRRLRRARGRRGPAGRRPVAVQDYLAQVREAALSADPPSRPTTEKTVTFTDGSTARVEVIIRATGYDLVLPYLPDNVDDLLGADLALYQRTFPPDLPGLEVMASSWRRVRTFRCWSCRPAGSRPSGVDRASPRAPVDPTVLDTLSRFGWHAAAAKVSASLDDVPPRCDSSVDAPRRRTTVSTERPRLRQCRCTGRRRFRLRMSQARVASMGRGRSQQARRGWGRSRGRRWQQFDLS